MTQMTAQDGASRGRRMAVVGAGVMGVGIAHAFLIADYDVTLVDVDETVVRTRADTVRQSVAGSVRRGKVPKGDLERLGQKLTVATSVGELAHDLELVVEAVPEQLALKRDVLRAVEDRQPSMIATNTGALSISKLAGELRRPEAFIGMHFFNPVWSMPLIEIVCGSATADATRAAAVSITVELGKTPIVVEDMPGFATSRLGLALGLEAMRMLQGGVTGAGDIDRAMQLGYGHPMGPLELTDLVGLDVRLHVAENLAESYGPRFAPPQILRDLVAAGRLGKKSGRGFYVWDASGRRAEGSSR